GAGRPATLDRGAGRPATLDRGAGRPATLDRGAGRPATLDRGAGRAATLDRGAGRPATLDRGAGRPATLDRGAGRPATLNRRRLRRRLSAAVLLLIGLAVAGGLAATLTPTPQVAVADESQSALLRTGKQLFDTSCVTCHGANLQG